MSAPGTTFEAAVDRARKAADDSTQEFGNFFLSRFLDLDINYNDDQQSCTVVLPDAAHLRNPQGSVHGGIIATAMDISMGHLCHRYLRTAVTLEINFRYFRPLEGTGSCVATVLRAGRRIVHLESRLTDESGRLVAFGVGSWHQLDGE